MSSITAAPTANLCFPSEGALTVHTFTLSHRRLQNLKSTPEFSHESGLQM